MQFVCWRNRINNEGLAGRQALFIKLCRADTEGVRAVTGQSRIGCGRMPAYLLISKFIFMISLMAFASSVMLASPWMVCLMTEEATAKLTMSMGL